MSNKERAFMDFDIILEENSRDMYGKIGTVFFAPVNFWNQSMLNSELKYPATISNFTFLHSVYGTGYAVFVPD